MVSEYGVFSPHKSTGWWSPLSRQPMPRSSLMMDRSFPSTSLSLKSESFTNSNSSLSFNQPMQHSCTVCPQIFSHVNDLRAHIYKCHPNVKDAFPFVCNVCQQGFFTKKTLKQHSEKHSSGFQCNICSKTFGYSRSLIRHQEQCKFQNLGLNEVKQVDVNKMYPMFPDNVGVQKIESQT